MLPLISFLNGLSTSCAPHFGGRGPFQYAPFPLSTVYSIYESTRLLVATRGVNFFPQLIHPFISLGMRPYLFNR